MEHSNEIGAEKILSRPTAVQFLPSANDLFPDIL